MHGGRDLCKRGGYCCCTRDGPIMVSVVSGEIRMRVLCQVLVDLQDEAQDVVGATGQTGESVQSAPWRNWYADPVPPRTVLIQ